MLRFTRLLFTKVRVRYAPSPTGMLHLGNLRTALFNYLFAKNKGGDFILRIEDTDQKRKVPGAIENIYETLKWVGIEVDEGPNGRGKYQPYVQSQRNHIYKQYLDRLQCKGAVYKCFCEQKERGKKDKTQEYQQDDETCGCSNLTKQTIDSYLKEGKKYATKLKSLKQQISFQDAVYKKLTFPASTMKDFVLIKADGYPTYHFANVVDDISIKISHVFRGEEWLTSTPKHIELYKLFDEAPPVFVHLPVIQSTERKKLSKRDSATSVKHYIENNYLPEGIVNCIALLGWSLRGAATQSQIFSMEDLVREFSIEDIHNYPAMFDPKQLQFFNNYYMKKKFLVGSERDEKRIGEFKGFVKKDLEGYSNEQLFAMSDIIIGRIRRYSDIEKYKYLYSKLEGWDSGKQIYAKQQYDGNDTKIGSKENFKKSLDKILSLFQKWKSAKQIDLSDLDNHDFHVLRFCLSGKSEGPNAIQICKTLGLEETILRLERFTE